MFEASWLYCIDCFHKTSRLPYWCTIQWSCGNWTLFSCKNILLFQEIYIAADHLSLTMIYKIVTKLWLYNSKCQSNNGTDVIHFFQTFTLERIESAVPQLKKVRYGPFQLFVVHLPFLVWIFVLFCQAKWGLVFPFPPPSTALVLLCTRVAPSPSPFNAGYNNNYY